MDQTETSNDTQPAGEAAVAERPPMSIDLANRPEVGWLDTVEGEIDDVDRVLKCLARDSAAMCQTCDAAQSQGELESRPVLARCASTKQPR